LSKIIVITGAGTGLGRALARRFAEDGEQVVLLGRRLDKLQAVASELGERAYAVQCDVAAPESVDAAFATVKARFGKLDVLINNAGVFEPFLVAEASAEQILGTLATNLAGPILCVRAAIALIPRGGHIINVSSETVAHNHYPFLTLYQCSKAGLERFSQNLGHELAPQGIRVTAVRAGPMIDADSGWEIDPKLLARFHEATVAAGLGGKPTTQFSSVPSLFRAVIDAPDDLVTPLVVLGARAP
jgi:meso-butanediol dehydrogenase / (S,S)-butanediol dehydrogenase / diacetyl reductase